MFLITPTFVSRKAAAFGLVAALLLRMLRETAVEITVYAINTVMHYEIWFVLGMCLSIFEIPNSIRSFGKSQTIGVALFAVFVVVSFATYDVEMAAVAFGMGLIACVAVLTQVIAGENKLTKCRLIKWLSRYTLPIFLLHTIFAAGLRSVLFKLGINSAVMHISCGLTISFVGPIIAAEIMKRVKCLDFLLYPGRYLKLAKS